MKRGQRGGIFFRLLFLMLFLCLLALLFAGRRPLMRFAGQFWVIDEPAAKSDALIVLGDDNYAGDRAFHAAELYREKVAPVVVASGRMLRRNSSVAEVMQHDLQSFGVPSRNRSWRCRSGRKIRAKGRRKWRGSSELADGSASSLSPPTIKRGVRASHLWAGFPAKRYRSRQARRAIPNSIPPTGGRRAARAKSFLQRTYRIPGGAMGIARQARTGK